MPMNNRLMRPRASGVFDPRTITGLQLWLDASAASTVFDADTGGSLAVSGGAVGRWEDRSGNGRHFTQSVANNRPTLHTGSSGRNGRSVLDFNGTTNRLKADITAFSQSYTILAVAAHDNGSAVQSHITDGATNRAVIAKSQNNATAFLFTSAAPASTANVFTSGTLVVLTALFNGASSTLRSNGTQVILGNPGTGSFGGNGTIIGCSSTENGQFWDGHICELLVYNKSLSATERSALESALGKKWGVTIA